MAPVGDRPFLAYLLDHWIGQGIQRFRLSTGYLADVIESHFGDSYRGASVEYIHEKSPLGTGGALRLALDIADWSNDMAVIANGDTWFPVSLERLSADAMRQKTPVTLAIKSVAENSRYGVVSLDENGKIFSFGTQADGSCLINGGCYLINTRKIKSELSGMPVSFSFENDFLVSYAERGHVGSSLQSQPFLDIGIPDDYRRAAGFMTRA